MQDKNQRNQYSDDSDEENRITQVKYNEFMMSRPTRYTCHPSQL